MTDKGAESAAAQEPWTIRKVVAWGTDDLKKRGSSSPRLDVELLLGIVLGMDRVRLIIEGERPLQKDELARYRALHTRRRAGEPVAYLVGKREFFGRTFRVDKRVLIPRPETELLVEVGMDRTKHVALSARVVDLCTGSGCVAISLARERPTTRVLGTDVSRDAIAVAEENATRLGAVSNCGFFVSDVFGAFDRRAKFDLITANPPYIPAPEIPTLQVDIRAFEPELALVGGPDGLDLVRRIVAEAPRFLAPGGVLAMELASGQAPEVARMLEKRGYRDIAIAKDLGGHERVVSGRR